MGPDATYGILCALWRKLSSVVDTFATGMVYAFKRARPLYLTYTAISGMRCAICLYMLSLVLIYTYNDMAVSQAILTHPETKIVYRSS